MSDAVSPLPHMPSWNVQKNIFTFVDSYLKDMNLQPKIDTVPVHEKNAWGT
jgi:hypothetical protein